MHKLSLPNIFPGNAGGYLGLFLGYALLHIPDLILTAYNLTRKRCCKKRGHTLKLRKNDATRK